MRVPGITRAEMDAVYRCRGISVDPKPYLGLCSLCRHSEGPIYDCTITRRSDVWKRRICGSCMNHFIKNMERSTIKPTHTDSKL